MYSTPHNSLVEKKKRIENYKFEIEQCINKNNLSAQYQKKFYNITLNLNRLANSLLLHVDDTRFNAAEALLKASISLLNEKLQAESGVPNNKTSLSLNIFSDAVQAAADYMSKSYLDKSAYNKLAAAYNKIEAKAKGRFLYREENAILRKVLGALVMLTGIATIVMSWMLIVAPIYFIWLNAPLNILGVGLIAGGLTLLLTENEKPSSELNEQATHYERSMRALVYT
ncbi:MAG TPA: hypothetical protein VHA13_01265, partial [Gammaproteobacteria bacterium]|nr:hypothetical protein [Gammaproteobacteria bacterium]